MSELPFSTSDVKQEVRIRMGKEGQSLPDLDDAFRIEVSQRYIELFEIITGRAFEPDTHPDPSERIRTAVVPA